MRKNKILRKSFIDDKEQKKRNESLKFDHKFWNDEHVSMCARVSVCVMATLTTIRWLYFVADFHCFEFAHVIF